MKKYSSGSFIDAAVRVYGSEADIITSFPASIIANGGNITPWAVYGNTVDGASVGVKTHNLFDGILVGGYYTDANFNVNTSTPNVYKSLKVYLQAGNYTISCSNAVTIVRELINGSYATAQESGDSFTFTVNTGSYVGLSMRMTGDITTEWDDTTKIMLNTGDSALPFEPWGYNVIISCGDTDYNCYISDVLRKSTGADPIYDIMSSTGIITRNVDTDGTPLITPTTESFTAPTLATVAGSQSVSFDTTIKPSKAELTYTGWHTHSDKKRSGGAWV